MDIRNGLISAYNGISASLGTSNQINFYKSTSNYFTMFNNGRLWLGSGTPVDAGFQADINGTTRLNGNVTLGGSIISNTIITGSGGPTTVYLSVANSTNPIFQVTNETTVSTIRMSQGGVGGSVLIGTNGQQGWGVGGSGSINIIAGMGSLAGWNNNGNQSINIGWNTGAITTTISDSIRLGNVNNLQSVGASSVAIGNSNWGLLVKGDGTTNQIRLGAVDLISNVNNSTTIGIGLSTSLSNVVLLGTSTQTVMIGAGSSTASGSTIFQVDSTTKGVLITRTTATSNISIPVQGLLTYVTSSSTEGLYYYESGSAPTWKKVITNIGSQSISGSLVITGSLTTTQGITGSLIGTSSWAQNALTASYVANASSFPYSGSAQITGSLGITGSIATTDNITASNALITGTITAQTLVVQTVTSSIVYSSGSNIFGNDLSNTQVFTGSLQVTGSTHYLLGNVGIGTITPQVRLSVSSSGDNWGLFIGPDAGNITGQRLKLGYFGSSNYSAIQSINDGTSVTSLILQKDGGNVGIGTTNPAYKLDISTGAQSIRVKGESTGYTQGSIIFQSATTDSPSSRGLGVYTFNEGTDATWFYGNGYNY